LSPGSYLWFKRCTKNKKKRELSSHLSKLSLELEKRLTTKKVSTTGAGKTTFLFTALLLLMELSVMSYISTPGKRQDSFAI